MVTFGEQIYRVLFDELPQATLIVRGQSILYANAAASRLIGSDPHTIARGELRALLCDGADFDDDSVRRTPSPTRVRRSDGSVDVLDLRCEPFLLGSERAWRVTLSDRSATATPRPTASAHADPPTIESTSLPDSTGVGSRAAGLAIELRALLNALADHFFRIDSHGRILEYGAPAGESSFLESLAIVGRPMRDLLPTENVEAFTDAIESAIDTGRVQTVEFTLDATGQTRFLEARIVPYAAERLIALVRDVTERKHQDQQTLLRHKLESIERLAGGMAHDFNNLLTAIVAHAELARFGNAGDAEMRGHVAGILSAAERASDLTRKLLSFSRNHVAELGPVDVRRLIESGATGFLRGFGSGIQLRILARDGDLSALADPRLLERALHAVVTNAAEAMPNGGRLTIALRSVVVGGALVAKQFGMRRGSYVGVFVRDTGFGMDGETLKRAFDPFFTTKREPESRGLGLTTAHGIVKQLGGHLFALSKRGRGTTIAMYLPRVPTDGENERSSPQSAIEGVRGRVVLAEDESSVREIVALVLRNQGYEVSAGENGAIAERLAESLSHDYDVLVTDVVMPRMGGRELAERLRARRPGLPVLYLSGYTQSSLTADDLKQPNTAFLQKPFTPMQLTMELARLLRVSG